MAAQPRCHIDSLPNELLGDVFEILPTPSLLPIAAVSRRFHSVVHSLIRMRLLHAASLSNRELILECYHPTAKLTTPYLVCDASGHAWEELSAASDLNALTTHYTHFKPTLKEEDMRPRRRHPRVSTAGQIPHLHPEEDDVPTVDVTLDSCELFTQLCAVTNVVTLGPRKGLFTGHVNVGDGVVRVWRDWLAQRAGREPGKGEESILWADSRKDVGVRFRVVEKDNSALQQPLLLDRDEDPVVSYSLVYEELLVRTSTLLLAVERAEDEDVQHSGLIHDPRGAVSKPAHTFVWANYWHPPPTEMARLKYVFAPA